MLFFYIVVKDYTSVSHDLTTDYMVNDTEDFSGFKSLTFTADGSWRRGRGFRSLGRRVFKAEKGPADTQCGN